MAGYQDLPPAAERADDAPERTVAEALSASALALTEHESTQQDTEQSTIDPEILGSLIRTGARLVSDSSTPPETVREWIETVNTIDSGLQTQLAAELYNFFRAVSRRFAKLDPNRQKDSSQINIPKRRGESFIEGVLERNPNLHTLPVHELPANAEAMILDYRYKHFVIGDVLRFFYKHGRVHPRTYVYVNELLITMVENGDLSYDDGKFHRPPTLVAHEEVAISRVNDEKQDSKPANDTTDEQPPRELTIDEKLREAGIGGGTGRPKGQVSSINTRQRAVERRRGAR